MKKIIFLGVFTLVCAFSSVMNAQVPGETCINPIVISSLPFNDSGDMSTYGNNYGSADVPPNATGAITNGTGSGSYLNGDEVVYSYTAGANGSITINTTNDDDWISLWAFTGCPFASTVGYHTATNGATREILNLPVTGGETYYIVISNWPTVSDTNYTIQITGTQVASCLPPSNLGASNLTTTSADLVWNENGTATAWDIEWGTSGFTPTGTPTIAGVNTNPYPLTGLSASTTYDFYVRADCGMGDESFWSGPYTFQTACSVLLSGTYTIGATGDYATFTDAVDAMVTCGISAAVTFNVMTGSGPYTEQIIIPEIVGASATNTITFNGNGETMTSTTTTGDRSLILLDGADYVTIENFNFVTQSDINNFVVQLTNNADFNTIDNCTFDMTSTISSTSATNAGIVVSGSLTSYTATTGDSGTNNTITNNTITGGHGGIGINGGSSISSDNIVENNIVNDNYSYGIYFRNVSSSSASHNSISRPTRSNTTTYSGLYFATGGENNMIDSNRIFNTHGGMTGNSSITYPIYHSAVDATPGNENWVINNLIYDVNNNGTLYGIYNSNSDGVFYYHNTISLDDPNATGGNTRGFYQTAAATGIEFKNNIVTITRGGTGIKYVMYFNTATSVISSDNNVLYLNAPAGTNHIGYSGSAQTTLADWQTTTSGDMNSVDVDPLYANSLGGDFTPSSSAVNNIGAALGVLTDINGDPRDAVTPDPGAYEFTPPACPQPSDLDATNFTATTADLGWTENGVATTWDIEIGVEGFIPTEVPTHAGVNTNPYTAGGLTALTDYDYYVRANCGGGDLSIWVGPYTFKTDCAGPLAGSYTVGSTGDFETLSDVEYALTTCGISASVTFNLLPGSGPYNEQIIIPEIVGASAVNTITFNGNGETLTAMTTTSDRYIIRLDGADYINIVNFNLVTQADTNNFVIHLTNNADFNTVDNCVIDLTSAINSTSATNAGIVVSGSLTSYTVTTGDAGSNNTFINNTITGGHTSIAINGGTSTSIGNVVENNIINDNYSYGAYFRKVFSSTISQNSVSRPLRSNTTTFSAIYFTVDGENNLIEANRIFNTHGGITGNSSATYGIHHVNVDATPGNENKVINNLIYDIKNNGTQYGIFNSSSDGVYYYHNTISLDDSDATGGLTRGVYQTTAASNIEVRNNIITITRGGTGTKYALFYNTGTSTIVSDNNVLYVNAPAGTNGIGYYDTTGYTTLADWQTANGGIYDNASVDNDPVYANPFGGDFMPTSPAVNDIGTPLGVLEDIDGTLRSVTNPDAGAYEFTPPACPQPSALTATNVTSTTADLGWTESGTATSWDIEWGVEGFAPTGTPTITGTATNPQPITGLTGNTSYDFYVRADCGVDGMSNWSGPFTFTTECDAFTAPYTMDFEVSMTNTPDCWSISSSVSNGWTFATSPSNGNNYSDHTTGSGYFAFAEASATFTPDATMITPLIDVSGLTEPMFEFYVYHYDNDTSVSSVSNSLTVEVFDGTNWNLVYFDDNGDVDAWERVEVDLTTLTITGNIQARFIVDATVGSNFYNDIGIDDVSFYEGSVCDDPTALTASNITTSSADLGWTENGTATTWDIEWGTAGFTPSGTPTIAGVTTNPYPLTGLNHDTMYEFYVRADCGGGDLSDWAGPFFFETLEIVCDAPTGLTLVDVTDTTVEVSWMASASETDGYAWSVYADGDDPLIDPSIFNGTVATGMTSVIVSGLTADTDYDFYVSTLCDQSVESGLAGPLNFTTDLEPCEAPTNLALVNIGETTVEISWNTPVNTGNVEGYGWRVMFQGDDPLVDPAVDEDFVAGAASTTTTITGLTEDTDYDLYLVTVCDLVNEYYSDPIMVTFTTDAAFVCEMPTDVALVGNPEVDSAEISWTASATETNGYEWAVFNTGDDPLVDPSVNSGTVATGVTSVNVTGLTAVTTYDFYVRTDCDPDGMSDWEGPFTFTTDQGASVDEFDINSIVFYPNPMADVVNITAQVEIEKVVIFSLTGQKLMEVKVGNTETQVDVSNFATGPYLLYVTTSTGKVGIFNLIKK